MALQSVVYVWVKWEIMMNIPDLPPDEKNASIGIGVGAGRVLLEQIEDAGIETDFQIPQIVQVQ